MPKPVGPVMLGLVSALAGLGAGQHAPPAESGSTIRTTVNEVVLDVVVRDKHGKPVKNLKPGDVEIYEDGVRQEIRNFRLVTAAKQRTTSLADALGPVKSVPVKPLRATNVVCIVFHNLDPIRRKYAAGIAEEFLNQQLPGDTWIGAFALGDRMTALHPFTTDRQDVLKAARTAFSARPVEFARASEALLSANPNRIQTTVTVDGQSATVDWKVVGGEVTNAAIIGADVEVTGSGARAVRGDQADNMRQFSGIQGMRETDQIITMIKELGTLPGRKSVLLLTTGLMTTGDPERFDMILNAAVKAGVTVYALDARGLDETSTALNANTQLAHAAAISQTQSQRDEGMGGAGRAADKSRQNDYQYDAVRKSDVQASLRALAEGTGGFLIANTNDFKKPFLRIAEEVDTHYEAAYRPTSNKYDGHLRKIEVKLARADYHAENRNGYFAMPDLKGAPELEPFEMFALAALNVQPSPRAFEFRAAAYRFGRENAASQFSVVFELPAAGLMATQFPESKRVRMHPTLLSLIKDANGQVVDKYSQDAPFEFADEDLASTRNSLITFAHTASLSPGRYTVETAVVDREGRRSSVNSFPIDSAEGKGIGVSTVALVQRVDELSGKADSADPFQFENKRVVPLLGSTLNAEGEAFVYFVVYPNKANQEKPRLEVQLLADGKLLATENADLPPADAAGKIPMVVKAVKRPGRCELKITALQGNDSASQSVNYTVVAK